MKCLTIDIETRSDIDIKKSGVYKYAESKLFDIMLISISVDGGKVTTYDLISGEKLPDYIIRAFIDESVIKNAFNVNFERICISVYLRRNYHELVNFEDNVGNYLSPVSWHCDMVHSKYLGMPSSLELLSRFLRLEQQKMQEGKDLIKIFCVPHDGDFIKNSDEPEAWELFKEYNKRDVEVELQIQKLLSEFPVPKFIWNEFYLDQYINDRGILLDKKYVENAVKLDTAEKERLYNNLAELTGLDNPNSASKMKEFLECNGIKIDSMDKKNINALIETTSDEIKNILTMYQQLSKTSTKKYDTMLNVVCDDNKARGMFNFYGAPRTGRFSGRLIQLQNLPQNHLENLEEVKELIKTGNFDEIRNKYDDISDVLSQVIRTSFIPPEGNKFVAADFSAIEARVVAWLAGEHWRIEAFKNGEDIYCASASKMFGVPVVKNGINGHLRQKGKIAELACGYGGSVGAIKAMGGSQLQQTDEELKMLVNDWRKASPNIVRFWYDVQETAEKAILNENVNYYLKTLKFIYEKGILFIELPSKRRLAYIRPKIIRNDHGMKIITYEGIGTNKKWSRLETHGAKLVENITQAVSRDLLMYSINSLKDFSIVAHVHDEIIVECNMDMTVQEVCTLMEQTPEWAEGLMIRADGYECKFYMKA